ncbi:MAG: hypothetical protein Q9169_008025 [Polycauliona sp. 2 TL-2023]
MQPPFSHLLSSRPPESSADQEQIALEQHAPASAQLLNDIQTRFTWELVSVRDFHSQLRAIFDKNECLQHPDILCHIMPFLEANIMTAEDELAARKLGHFESQPVIHDKINQALSGGIDDDRVERYQEFRAAMAEALEGERDWLDRFEVHYPPRWCLVDDVGERSKGAKL